MPTLNASIEFDMLRGSMEEWHDLGGSWESIAKSFNSPKITRAHVYKMVVNHWEPRRTDLRQALGLQPYIEVPACPVCSVPTAHTHAHGERAVPQDARVIANPGKDKRRRLPIRRDNMQSAAKSIINNLEPAQVRELIQNLVARVNGRKETQ